MQGPSSFNNYNSGNGYWSGAYQSSNTGCGNSLSLAVHSSSQSHCSCNEAFLMIPGWGTNEFLMGSCTVPSGVTADVCVYTAPPPSPPSPPSPPPPQLPPPLAPPSTPSVSSQLSGGGDCANTPVSRVGPNGGTHGACCHQYAYTGMTNYCVKPFIVLHANALTAYSMSYPPDDHTILRPMWWGSTQIQCDHWCWIMTGIAGSCVGYTTGGAQYFAGGWMYSYAGSVSYDRRYATVQHPTSSGGIVDIMWSFDRISWTRSGTFSTYSCTGF